MKLSKARFLRGASLLLFYPLITSNSVFGDLSTTSGKVNPSRNPNIQDPPPPPIERLESLPPSNKTDS